MVGVLMWAWKSGRLISPTIPTVISCAYMVAEINFLADNQHLPIIAHFAMGDCVCFNCLHNGHLRNQCDPAILRPPRDLKVIPHVYDKLMGKEIPEDPSWAIANPLSEPVMPEWWINALKAREEEKKAEAEVRSKVEAENKARQEEKSANESRANTGRGRHGTSRGFTMGHLVPHDPCWAIANPLSAAVTPHWETEALKAREDKAKAKSRQDANSVE
ncbi:hypothetical protein BKA90DRAFT_154856 [Yarrowia lipolytica]|nr:hypothetical protein BKA90DRAFT_154856 [Yarrowia lipolytica]